ncbi:MAG: 2-phospho-L-lactate guanylyltransferase [Desulfitobacteriaceae bacterium]
MGGIIAIVPFKGDNNCKSRLKPVLTPEERVSITRIMYARVLHTLKTTARISGRFLVSGENQEFRNLAAANSFTVLPDNGEGLNSNIKRALLLAKANGFRQALIVPTDLPLISSHDIEALIELGDKYDAVIVPSKEGTGTNSLLVPLKLDFSPSFGPDSFNKHIEILQKMGLTVGVYWAVGLSFDLDTPEDWLAWGKDLLGGTITRLDTQRA